MKEKMYGWDVCPLLDKKLVEEAIEKYGDESYLCGDYARLGTVACGLCGANRELAEDGQINMVKGIVANLKNKEVTK